MISLHAAGIGGLIALIVFMLLLYDIRTVWQLVTVIVAGGVVMSSRLWLKGHTPTEVWTGLFTGAATMALSLLLLLR
jgi:membrane-associated phospholipid phosphatase